MAISLPKIYPPFPTSLPHKPLSFSTVTSLPCKLSPSQDLHGSAIAPALAGRRQLQRCRTTAQEESSSSLSSIITDLHHEQEEVDSQETLKRWSPERLAERWPEIHGRDDWAGLLDPMDPLLRSELIRYGEYAQACYDAFDGDPFSRYCGSCKFNRRHFFSRLGFSGDPYQYEVTRYLYATSHIRLPNFFTRCRWPNPWSNRANWIGYVAVSSDAASTLLRRRDIVIAWRGTVTQLEWVADLMDFLRSVKSEGIPCPYPQVKVESGFVDYYTDRDPSCRFCKYSARQQVLAEVRKLVLLYAGAGEKVSISVTGHSLGSALATLCAYDIVETGLNKVDGNGGAGEEIPVTVFSYSGPRVGNKAFKERFEGLGVKCLRVVNVHDTVPRVPGIFFNERIPPAVQQMAEGLPWSYWHVGVELALDHRRSPFLKVTGDPICFHNLEAHLHLLDGYHGRGERFKSATGRDPALVNKACDFLKDHLMVPPAWRQDENKGMIRAEDGKWVLPERPKLDDHPADMHQHLNQLGFM